MHYQPHQILKHLIIFVIVLIGLKGFSQDCGFTITVPQDITICEESDILLDGAISGTYFGFEWNGTDGFFENVDLTPTVTVSQTTTYTLTAFSNPTTNLITNGDFSGGNSGFTTQYSYMPDLPGSTTELWSEGTYSVVSNPNNVHTNFDPCADHTGGGNMMVVNGASSLAQVWCQTVAVMPNTTYIFQAFAASVEPTSPAILQFSINSVLLGSPFGLSGATCVWEEFYETWFSGGNTSVQICITNQNTAGSGNDFALDDIFFGPLCKEEEDFTVTFSTFDILPSAVIDLDCNHPESNLSITPLPSIPGYQYGWNTSNGNIISNTNGSTITVGSAGQYAVTVTNQFGCTMDYVYDVNGDFTVPDVEIDGNLMLDCYIKSSILDAYSTDGNVIYSWNLPNGSQVNGPSVNATTPGNYTVTGTASNGCTGTATVEVILENSTIQYTADSSGTLTCSSGFVDIFLDITTNVDSINWEGPNIVQQNINGDTITVAQEGTYIYELFLGVDCSIIDSIVITETLPQIAYTLSEPDTLTCNNAQTNLFLSGVSGVSEINWYAEGQLISTEDTLLITEPGVYITVLTDMFGCTKTDSIVVSGDFAKPNFTVIIDSIDCIDKQGQFFVTAPGIKGVLWEGQGTTSQDLNPVFDKVGNYTLTVTGENGCTETQSFYLPSSQSFPAVTADIEPLTCTNPSGIIQINTNPSATIQWSDMNGNTGSGTTISSTSGGTFDISVTAANGCITKTTYVIPVDTIHPIISPIASDILTCSKEFVSPNVTASNYDKFRWSGNGIKDSLNLEPEIDTPGKYTLTLTNENGCKTTTDFIVTEDKTKPNISAYAEDLTCTQPETTLSITGELNLNISISHSDPNGINANRIVKPGTITIHAVNGLGCDTTINIEIKSYLDKPIIHPEDITLNCLNPQAWVSDSTLNPLLEYSWITPTGLIKEDSVLVTNAANYTLIAINEYGCESRVPIVIKTDFQKPDFLINGSNVIKCNEDFTEIKIETDLPLYDVFWKPNTENLTNETSAQISNPGTYSAQLTNPANGCINEKGITITKQGKPETIDLDINQPACYGEKGSLKWINVSGGASPYTILVNGNSLNQNNEIDLSGGKYLLKVSDTNGCTLQEEIEILVPGDFGVNAGRDTIIELSESHKIQSTTDLNWSDVSEIKWSPTSTLSCSDCPNPIATPEFDTEYTITIYDENGCVRTDAVWVRVKFTKGYIAPQIINLNSSSGNNKFTLYGLKSSVKSIKYLRVYDRWGNLVFLKENILPDEPESGWDGKFYDQDVQPGVFVWIADIVYKDDTTEIATGDVTIIK